ncbi:hypothetical protein D3C87_1818680 [compost metagenome]
MPQKTPDAVVAKLIGALNEALADAEVRKRLEAIGAMPPEQETAGAEYMLTLVNQEISSWSKILQPEK